MFLSQPALMMMVMAEALCTNGPVRSERQAKDTARWMRRHGWPFAAAERCDDCGGWHAAANARPVGDLGNERALAAAWAENLTVVR